jgi:hypothetical protein
VRSAASSSCARSWFTSRHAINLGYPTRLVGGKTLKGSVGVSEEDQRAPRSSKKRSVGLTSRPQSWRSPRPATRSGSSSHHGRAGRRPSASHSFSATTSSRRRGSTGCRSRRSSCSGKCGCSHAGGTFG